MNQTPESSEKSDDDLTPSYIVGIGASAGGLQAIETFFDHMPPDSGLAFVIVQHLSPDFKSLMDELLARHTTMAIHKVTDRLQVERNSIYLIPPEQNMALSNGKLLLSDQDTHRGLNLPIDIFFRSLGMEAAEKSVCIVLSGTGSDGSRGLIDVSDAGGLVIAQSTDTSGFDGMPRAAVATGRAHLICAPESMPSKILEYVTNPDRDTLSTEEEIDPTTSENAISAIFRLFRHEFGIDFSLYKAATINRRIERRMTMLQLKDVGEYARLIETDREEMESLYRDLLVEVTQFFRDPDAFQVLRDEIVPKIVADSKGERELRVWVAGCATGEEAFSLAMLFHDALLNAKSSQGFKVFATDVHTQSLETASTAVYPEAALMHVPEEFRSRYFNVGNGLAHIKRDLRLNVIFAANDLTKDPPFTKIDMISCRNVLIYLEQKIQKRILSLFHFGLRTGGTLMLGPSETLSDLESEFEPIDRHWRIYQKRRDIRLPDASRMPLTPVLSKIVHDKSPPFVATAPATAGGLVVSNVHEDLLRKYVPPSLLVNRFFELLHSFGDARKLLVQPEGKPTLDVLKLIQGDLRVAVSAALHKATQELDRIVYKGVRARVEGEEDRMYTVVVEPYKKSREEVFLICMEETEILPSAADEGTVFVVSDDSSDQISHLERELAYTRETLQTTVEELESSNEELQSTNEELVASNEELQSTNEELHSVNEELYTVNAEHKQKIEELTQLTSDMDNLLKSTQIGTIFLDRNFHIRMFTPAISSAFNVMQQDIGRPIDHIAYKLDNPNLLTEVASVLASENPVSVEVKAKGGRVFLQRIQPYRCDDGRVDGIVLTLTDITALREAEAMVSLTTITEELPSFAYAVSHDLQTPLRHIYDYCEIISEELGGHNSELIQKSLDVLQSSSLSVRRLIECLLEYSRVNTETIEYDVVDMSTIVNDVLDKQRDAIQRHRAVIEHSELPNVFGDKKQLHRLLFNLVDNAIQYCSSRRPHIKVVCSRQGEFWEFSVADNGIGIDDDHRDSVFTIFRRLGFKPNVAGRGIGLAIARRIVTRHGGRIWLTSDVGVGTTVSFTLPVHRED
ncbi:CheR family methyltransferase [Stieleria marina]|uniref:Phytochrome-like protein cph1 n=1 Tax=Stieleria marina TaxID=1930275 RepID=A0A517NWT2_9BACT|nr:Phytochrome-like protein cph1 [Planctomycetes bacterium K23_9]